MLILILWAIFWQIFHPVPSTFLVQNVFLSKFLKPKKLQYICKTSKSMKPLSCDCFGNTYNKATFNIHTEVIKKAERECEKVRVSQMCQKFKIPISPVIFPLLTSSPLNNDQNFVNILVLKVGPSMI